jgi:HEAT repeat protein
MSVLPGKALRDRVPVRALGLLARVVGYVLLPLPAALMLIASQRATEQAALMLWLGTAFQVLVCTMSFISQQTWRQSAGPSLITLYVIALGWVWLGTRDSGDWYPHLAMAVLLVVPLVVFAQQVLTESGASALRQARKLAQRLASRKDWPAELVACKSLPEVKALREALHIDAAPALELLAHARPEVRVAALAALEFRQNWRRGQAELVLQTAQRDPAPAVRSAAIMALANVEDLRLVEVVAEFLRDPAPDVRQAATEALLWNCERRWSWIRHAVRRALGDPTLQTDGPLRHNGQLLTDEAVVDLTAWSAEKGILAMRAALTLGAHYARVMNEQPDEKMVAALRRQLGDPHAPPALRIELASVLRATEELDRDSLVKMLDASNPAPLRLTAVEMLLALEENYEALAALRDLARLPNREIALATADVVQRRLGVDMGLALGQQPPPVHTRQAADVARRVMNWAVQHDLPALRE